MASFTGLKNVGEDVLEYMMKHRPWPDEELSAGLHDLDNVFPGIYGRHASDYKTFADDPRIDAQSLKVINAVRGNPEAMVDIYRAVPKGVRDFNTGDWVSISKNYAKQHGESALNGDYDLIKAKARAADISEPGDSIAEQGYWGSPIVGKVTRGILPLFAAGGAAAALTPSEAEASPLSKYANILGKFADSLDYNDLPKNWADNPEIVQAAGELYRDMGTESPFFKAWFGKSKVVDDAGKPLTVYHGTDVYDLKKFKPGQHGYLGGGIYTTPNRNVAERYTNYDTVHNLYERMENPFVVSNIDPSKELFEEIYGSPARAEKEINKRTAKQGNFSQIVNKNDAKKIASKGYDGIFWNTPAGVEYSTLDPTALKATSNRGTFNPSDPNIYRAIPFAAGGAGAAAALAPGEASASVPADQYRFPADEPGYVNREPGLGTPLVDVADLATAPIGAATAAGRAAAVAAEPFIAYGMDKAGNWLGDKVNGLLGYFGWGE